MKQKQSVQVSILGRQFNLKSEASAEQVHRVARYAEDQITKVTSSGRAIDSLQATILALLNVSAEHLEGAQTSSEFDPVEKRINQLIEKIELALV